MKHSFDSIESKPSDYKVCLSCKRINWYENEICIACGESKFDDDAEEIENATQSIKTAYEESLESNVDHITILV